MQKRMKSASLLAAAGIALLTLTPAFGDEKLKPQTLQDLNAAMQNEALAVLKYKAFAEHARKEGKIAFAELLERTAKTEQAHFMEEARLSGLAREDWHNLSDAIVAEYAEASRTYAQMAARADAAGDKEVAETFRVLASVEARQHQEFLAAVKKSLKPD